ncbi:MAG: S41 family peptidase [Fluviicola sp.]
MKNLSIFKWQPVLFAVFFCGFSFAQNLSSEEVKSDLELLRSSILKYQPGIQESAPHFKKTSENLIANLRDDSLSFLEYFKHVSRLCVMAGEGHYSLGNWQDTVHRGFGNNTYAYFPADVQVIDNRLYIEDDFSKEQQLTPGSEITRINGKSAAAILQELYFCTPSDGAIISNIVDELDATFPFAYYMYIEQPAYFGVTIKNPSGQEQTVSIQARIRQQQKEALEGKEERPLRSTAKNPVYSLRFHEDYALLTLRSFNNKKLNKQDIKPRRFYKSIFDTLEQKNAKNLVIDLRGNSGGLFTMAQEFIPFVVHAETDNRFQRRSISWEGKVRNYKFRKQKRKAFEGQMYVLIDGGTFSSASTLARYLKEQTNAIIIGEESGSRYESFVAGSKQYVKLPNSGVEIGIPRYLIEFGPGKKQQTTNRGVLPHHKIEYSILHILANRDLHLETVEELIER